MDVYQAIAGRRTIRDFTQREIPAEIIQKILSAGLQAPSNDHLRQWEFILVQDRAQRELLLGKIRHPKDRKAAAAVVNRWGLTIPSQRNVYIEAIPRQSQMLLDAAVLIMPCFFASGDLLHPESLSSLNSFASIWCCIENILVAAASEGIFGVTRIPFEPERRHIRRILKVPAGYEVPCYLALGYPAENAGRLEQYPVSVKNKTHMNSW
jgi:nitroreductase